MSSTTPPVGAACIGTAADASDAFTLRLALATYLILWPFLWASGRLDDPTHNIGMGAAVAATLVLLCWRAAAPASYRALRPWSIGDYQILSPALFTIADCQLQMQGLPTPGVLGAIADMMRVLTGCRAHMLLSSCAPACLWTCCHRWPCKPCPSHPSSPSAATARHRCWITN